MHNPMSELRRLIDRHATDGRSATPVRGLTLFKVEEPIPGVRAMYRPTLCVVAQGHKRVVCGERVWAYDPSAFLVVTVDLPVTGCILQASREEPYLGLTLDLDPDCIAALLLDGEPARAKPACASSALAVGRLTAEMIDALTRLLRLLDQPEDLAALAPLIGRELHHRLLRSEHGGLLRQIATADSHLSQVGRAADWMRSHHARPMRVEALAERAGMSVTSFHRHFKAVTGLSPLQFRTRIRLQEARRLLLTEGQDAGSIGFAVGYESPSQFSRDYRRLFGSPPGADAARLRAAELLSVAPERE